MYIQMEKQEPYIFSSHWTPKISELILSKIQMSVIKIHWIPLCAFTNKSESEIQ